MTHCHYVTLSLFCTVSQFLSLLLVTMLLLVFFVQLHSSCLSYLSLFYSYFFLQLHSSCLFTQLACNQVTLFVKVSLSLLVFPTLKLFVFIALLNRTFVMLILCTYSVVFPCHDSNIGPQSRISKRNKIHSIQIINSEQINLTL